MTIEVLLEDAPCIAVNKPLGLLTQGPPTAKCTLESLVKDYIRDTYAKQGRVYLGVPHRLDRSVSGAVIFARNSKGARRLAEIFRDRRVQKTYLAILEQRPDRDEGTLVDAISKSKEEAKGIVVDPKDPDAQPAELKYRIRNEVPGGWLVEVEPITGRFHQIRVQLAARGWPVIGDTLYGSSVSLDPKECDWRDDGSDRPPMPIALHARRLELPHPVRFDPMVIEADPPAFWKSRGWFPPHLQQRLQ